MNEAYPKIGQLKSVTQLQSRLNDLGLELPIDKQILTQATGSPLAAGLDVDGFKIGNRWCIHPMEGWDANRDGSPSELTMRRWSHFGQSGAKWIWGGEACAVQPSGRANPNQSMATPENAAGLAALRLTLVDSHKEQFSSSDDLFIGLQLTHSGRFCRPNSKALEPRIAYHNPLLDEKFGISPDDDSTVWSDSEIEQLIDDFVAAAGVAEQAGYHFVDIKSCHGYLLHEFLSARTREGKFGGDLEGRTKLLRTIVGRVRNEFPNLKVVVRLSIFDTPPFMTSREVGQPMDFQSLLPYQHGFGLDPLNPMEVDFTEPFQLIETLVDLGVVAINISCGSPYYNPHVQRPAIFPPSDGYQPPEDPLVGVVRQIQAARACKLRFPNVAMVGTGYSYLQDFLPHVAQAVIRDGWIDSVGLGRMVLSYPDMPADTLSNGTTRRKSICRTFSDCTTAPRNGLISGCFPLDPHYKAMPAAGQLKRLKSEGKEEKRRQDEQDEQDRQDRQDQEVE